MNDPHVTTLHYWVEHDDSVDYNNAEPLDYEDDLAEVHLEKGQLTLRPKGHFASAQEAREAFEGFIRNWEFVAALEAGSKRLQLIYVDADVIDRNPTPPSPGVVELSATSRGGILRSSAKVTMRKAKYPNPPEGSSLDSSNPTALAMLSRLDRYHQGRETLATMAYFCLTVMKESAKAATETSNAEKATRDHYGISDNVQGKVSGLSTNRGGIEARKGTGLWQEFTSEEKKFLLTAVQTFIRRVAEKSADPAGKLSLITMADLPELESKVGNTEGETVRE